MMFSRKGLLMTDRKAGIGNMPLAVGSGMKVNIYFYHYPENKVFAYQYNLILEDTAKHFIIWERYYSEEEITSILRKVGFRKITLSIYNGLFSQAEIANIIVRQRNFFKTTCTAAFLRTLAADAQIDVLWITILV